MCEASSVNQFRLHQGYHYPRSESTGHAAKSGLSSFESLWGSAISRNVKRYYAVSRSGSRVSGAEYVSICSARGLSFEHERPKCLRGDRVDTCIRVSEEGINPVTLRRLCWQKLRRFKVHVYQGKSVRAIDLVGFADHVIVATYSSQNETLAGVDDLQQPYEFRLAELPHFRLPRSFRGVSTLIMDGPFPCLDPIPSSANHVVAHVELSNHSRQTGWSPDLSPATLQLLDGNLHQSSTSRYQEILKAAEEYFPSISAGHYLGSQYAVRTLLPGVEATDERPSLIQHSRTLPVTSVFSGKLSTCVDIALRVVRDTLGRMPDFRELGWTDRA